MTSAVKLMVLLYQCDLTVQTNICGRSAMLSNDVTAKANYINEYVLLFRRHKNYRMSQPAGGILNK